MDDFIRGLSSPAWWLGVVFVGILINIISSYLLNPIDRATSWIGMRIQARSVKKTLERDHKILWAAAHPERRAYLRAYATRLRLNAVMYLLFCILCALFEISYSLKHQYTFLWFSSETPLQPKVLRAAEMLLMGVAALLHFSASDYETVAHKAQELTESGEGV